MASRPNMRANAHGKMTHRTPHWSRFSKSAKQLLLPWQRLWWTVRLLKLQVRPSTSSLIHRQLWGLYIFSCFGVITCLILSECKIIKMLKQRELPTQEKHKTRWKSINQVSEMKAFFPVYLAMGILKLL